MKGKEILLEKNDMTLKLEKFTKSIDKHQVSRNEFSKKKSLQEKGITLIALVVTILFSYDEKIKCSNIKGFLLQTI